MHPIPFPRLLVPALLVAATCAAYAQINTSITSITSPSGTATAPLYVIDSDADNLDAAYERDKIACGGVVQFTNSSGSATSGTYRLSATLKHSDGTVVASPSYSASQSVTSLASGASTSKTFSLNIDPVNNLGAGLQYTVEYKVQAYVFVGLVGGTPFYWWQDTAGAASSTAAFTVCHFNDTPENTANRNARGWLRGAATWTKTHAVSSGSGTQKQFTVTVPYSLARYDVGGSTASISVRFTAIVTDDLGNAVAMESGGLGTSSFSRNASNAGTPNTPHLFSSDFTLSFSPSAQLDSANRRFRVAVKFEHLETPTTSTYRDNGTSPATSLQRLLHFNGRLFFGGVATNFNSVSNTPAAGSTGVNFINTTINPPSAAITGFPDYSVAAGGDLGVRLESDGDAVLTSGSRDVTAASGEVGATYGGVRVTYPDTILDAWGAYTYSTIVHLPQGLSYAANASTSAGRYAPEIALGARALTDDFKHTGTLSLTTPVTAGIFDEARPMLYPVSNFSLSQSGLIGFNATAASWAHKTAYADLDTNQAAGAHATPDMQFRLSNEGYLRYAHLASPRMIYCIAAADGTARMRTGELDVNPGSYKTHFPKESTVAWSGPGLIKINEGDIDPTSQLDGASPVLVTYDGSCEGDACGPPPGSAVDGVTLVPLSGKFQFTADGGVHADASMSPAELHWGIRGDGTTAHRTDDFSASAFYAPGNQLYQSDNPFASSSSPFAAKASVLSPGSLLLAGYQASAHSSPVYPGTPGYESGNGWYAGATMSVPSGGMPGASRLADMTTDYPYTLQGTVSKYYVRPSGVSGRHVAVEGSFDGELTMYDYEFQITRFQLTYLSNKNEDSWINGSVEVPNPSGFTQAFEELTLTCTGALDQAEIDPDDAGAKPLTYWNGSFTPLAMSFNPQTGGGCYGDRFLVLGLVSGAANIDTPLAGSLAFMPDGNIGTIADAIEGVDSRLGLPGTLPLEGPGEEIYQLTPVCKLYFNNPEAVGAAATGYVGFAARCNVPFFEDLKVHVMTSAQAGVPASVYLTSGWTESGQTFFTQTDFDATHRGFPGGAVQVEDYRNPSAQNAYVPVAKQSLFGIVPLSYPLKWSPTGRYFNSWSTIATPLLVLNVEHQVDYLSADNAEISFGAQYDGLPQINLVSTAIEAADEQIGAAKALTEAASGFITDTLNDGVDAVGDLASDTLEAVLDEVINAMESEIINPLYDAVDQSYQDAVAANTSYGAWVNTSTGALKSEFDRYLDGSIGPASESIKGRLDQLHNISGDAIDLIAQVQGAIDQGILAIDAVTSRIEVVSGNTQFNLNPPTVPSVPTAQLVNGILAEVLNESTGQLERQIVQNLVGALISELAPPDLAAILTPLAGELTAEANAELNALLADFDPTLDRVTEALLEARAHLVTIRGELAAGQDIFISFQQIVTGASAEIDGIVDGLRATAYGFIDEIAAAATFGPATALGTAGDLMGEFSREEFVALIRNELRDQLLAAGFIQQIQYTLRQHISELEMAMNSAIDSAFGEVSRMCRQLIQEALGPIDDAINELIGDVNVYVGAGSIDGYAHIQGDTLRRLRIDAKVQFKIPEEMELQAYFEMLCYDSETDVGSAGCLAAGEQQVEVKIGALDVPLDWISPDLRANLEVKFSMQTDPSVYPKGIGGALEMTGGELDFQSLKITDFAAAIAVGVNECYLAATARVIVSSYEAAGGIFFGRTCSIEPLELVDPDVAALLGPAPFTGAYVYGEVWIPISEVVLGIPASCLFRISAGVGAGAFYFVEGPTFGGKMLLGVSGEALCVVSIGGQVSMIGVMSGGSLRFSGKGTLTGRAGWCPLCVEFSESANITYQDGSWSVDF
ncbi:MAG: hypothetical protein FJ385_07430 [Verrucomicrobia bacterium]|nr:hypothetical protein [Verrucomicrobiota bacterium]